MKVKGMGFIKFFSSIIILTIFSLSKAAVVAPVESVIMVNQTEEAVAVTDVATSSENASTETAAIDLAEINLPIRHQSNAGGNLKKAYAPNATEISSWRDLVRGVLTGNVAPAIKLVLTNLDRDLFKIFTPTDAPETTTYHVIYHQEIPTETTTKPPLNGTTSNNEQRHLEQGAMKYRIRRTSTVATTTAAATTPAPTEAPKAALEEEDDEDESFEVVKRL